MFQELLVERSAAIHADFLRPHLTRDTRLLDCGCGAGSITVGLADAVGSAVGLDVDAASLRPAIAHLEAEAIANLRFVVGDGARLPFPDGAFDAVLMHSVLEAAQDPLALVVEAYRVLRPAGLLAAASVEYGGLVLEGPHAEVIERFYEIRERLWALERIARPRSGRALRKLLHGAGFVAIEASAHYLSYGTPGAVRAFGRARAGDCADPWFSSRALAHGLLTEGELERTRRAWETWSQAPESFLAFAWCRVLGRKPPGPH